MTLGFHVARVDAARVHIVALCLLDHPLRGTPGPALRYLRDRFPPGSLPAWCADAERKLEPARSPCRVVAVAQSGDAQVLAWMADVYQRGIMTGVYARTLYVRDVRWVVLFVRLACIDV